MSHFAPCHKEIAAEESAYLFINSCYKIYDDPKIIVSDRDPMFVGKFWQSFMVKLNTRFNMSNARHRRTDGWTERVIQPLQTLLRCFFAKCDFHWTSHLSMVKFY